MKISKVVVIA